MLTSFLPWCLLVIGASAGASFRYGFYLLFERLEIASYFATTAVNIIGSFIIGIFAILFASEQNTYLNMLFITGFLGSFTTFSSFSMASVSLIQQGAYTTLFFIVFMQIVLGFSACFLGVKLAEKIASI